MRRIIVTAIMALASARFIPAGYAQTIKTLYSFTNHSGDGANPIAGVTMDAAGNIYGTTEYGGTAGYGTVYELSPPSSPGGAWTETALHSFAGPPADGKFPWSSLIVANGVYGTTENGGTGSCSAGGTLEGCGVAFSLAPPSSPGRRLDRDDHAQFWRSGARWPASAGTDSGQPRTALRYDYAGRRFEVGRHSFPPESAFRRKIMDGNGSLPVHGQRQR